MRFRCEEGLVGSERCITKVCLLTFNLTVPQNPPHRQRRRIEEAVRQSYRRRLSISTDDMLR